MKQKAFKSFLAFSIICLISIAVNAQKIDHFIGNWDFNTLTGAVGYETGIMEIEKDAVVTTFSGIENTYPSDWAAFEADTFKFNFDVDGDYVKCYLKVADESNLKGYCKWDTGESVVILTRKTDGGKDK
jgi:hypothetical protein